MRDVQLYQQILGLTPPWSVSRVELVVEETRVNIWVEHEPGQEWSCPECDRKLSCRDHAEERSWRHLDTCQFKTYLHARIPRVECPEHGVRQVHVPWAEPHGRFTLLMERLIIDMLQQCMTSSGTARLMGISWDEASAVMQRAVARGQARKATQTIEYLGVDEKAFKKGYTFMTLVCDLKRATVVHVSEGRTTESLAGYYQSLSSEQRGAIQAVAMDMWAPYIRATQEALPLADRKIVFDRFHVMKEMNELLDIVRRREHAALLSDGGSVLKGTQRWWLYARTNVPEKHRAEFAAVRAMNLKTSRAWAIKETLRQLWSYRSRTWAAKFMKKWMAWVSRCRMRPIQRFARTLKRHLDGLLNYCTHQITNGVAEGLNSKIMTLKRRACGYANPESFKTAIYFFCGGLDLYPR